MKLPAMSIQDMTYNMGSAAQLLMPVAHSSTSVTIVAHSSLLLAQKFLFGCGSVLATGLGPVYFSLQVPAAQIHC